MKNILLFIFFTASFLQADANLTNEVNATLMEMILAEDKKKNEERIYVIENILEKKKIEEAKR